jgi:hypothetical protein
MRAHPVPARRVFVCRPCSVEALPPEKRRGDPAQLHALFDALAAEYPQLAAARAKAAE